MKTCFVSLVLASAFLFLLFCIVINHFQLPPTKQLLQVKMSKAVFTHSVYRCLVLSHSVGMQDFTRHYAQRLIILFAQTQVM